MRILSVRILLAISIVLFLIAGGFLGFFVINPKKITTIVIRINEFSFWLAVFIMAFTVILAFLITLKKAK